MQIQKVTAKNFYSFRNLDLSFDSYKGIVRINGYNLDSGGSNGSGKSSIFESICFGLFGKSIRKSTEESIVNIQSGEGLEVTIELFKPNVGDIFIKRCKRPTSLILEINGKNSCKDNAASTQEYLEELLETDYKSFIASIVFGQHSDTSFLESSAEDKRKIIRNCFNLEDLFSKRESVKQLKSSYQAESKVLQTLIESIKKDIEKESALIPDKKYVYIELPDLNSILESEKKINSNNNQIKSLSSSLSKEVEKLKKISESISKGIVTENKECPVCKSSYTKSQSAEDIGRMLIDRKAIEEFIDTYTLQLSQLKEDNSTVKTKYSSSEWAKYNHKNSLVLESKRHSEKLEELQKQLSDYDSKVVNLTRLTDVMKFWEQAFSEKGMVRYIIRNILEYFNLKCNEYISILTNNQFTIQFNDELSETIVNNNIQTKYISLSGGEKRKINLAIMLAIQDLSSKISKTECNLIFFDEVCDNIDDSGIEAIHNLLNTLIIHYPNKVVLLITHNSKLQELLSESKEIKVIKNKGISVIE